MSLSARALSEHKSGPFCILPFSQIVVDSSGDCYPCEAVRGINSFNIGNIKEKTIEDIWNSEKIKNIRLQMIQGKRNSVCDKNCHNDRELTCKSLNHISRYPNIQKKLTNDICLKTGKVLSYPSIYLLKSSNICNLACRYCKKESSNTWADLDDRINNRTKKNNTLVGIRANEIEKIFNNLDSIDEIILFGGEPTMYMPHIELLEKLILHKLNEKIRIVISTNFMQLGVNKKNIFDIINNFPNSIIWGSVDAYNDVNDYIRINSSFKKIEENVTYVVNNCKNIKLYLNSVISIMNIFSVIDLHKDWYNKGLIGKDSIRYTILDYPPEYNILYLSDELKSKIVYEYEEYIKWLKMDGKILDLYPNNFLPCDVYLKKYIIEYLKNTSLDLNKFLKVRKIQKENINKVNNILKIKPKMLDYLEEELNKKLFFVGKKPISFS